MSEIKITDLVPEETIKKVKELNTEIQDLLTTYTDTAKELAKGVDINVRVVGDIDKLEKLLVEKTKEATITTEKLNTAMEQHRQVIDNTTNTISRQLMEQERVNKTQREAYNDTEKFKALMERVNGSYEQRIQRLVQVEKELKDAKDRENALNKELKNGEIEQKRYTAIMTELRIQTRSLSQEKADLTTHLKNEEREMQSVEGSYRNQSQRLELMKKAYKDLTAEERDSPLGKEMETAIQDLDAHLKDLAADMGEFQRNVGNYAIANSGLKKKYDELVGTLATLQNQYAKMSEAEKAGESGQELAKSIEEVSTAAKQTKQTLDEQTQAIEDAKRSLEGTSGSTSSVKKDLKELVLEIANLTIQYRALSEEERNSAEGQELAQHIQELTEQAGVLKDAIADTNAAISNAASDTRSIDQFSAGLKLLVDGFGLATGAANMLGISNEDLAEIQTKLQSAIAASNALQGIQNALQSQSALMQGINLVQTKLRTAAENLHTAAQGRGIIATKALTVAQWAFNAAANANPIGLIVVGIVAATAAVWGLVKAFQAFFGPGKDAYENYKEQKQALDDLCDANDKLIDRMKARGATEAELLNQSLLNKQSEKEAADALFARASELYDDDEDEYKEALEAKKKADEDFEQHKEDGLNYLLKIRADTNAKVKEMEIGTLNYKIEIINEEKRHQLELAEYLLANGKLSRELYEDIVASVNKAAELKISDAKKQEEKKVSTFRRSSGGGSSRTNDAKKQADDLKKAVREGEDALLKIIEDSHERQRQAEILAYNRQLKDLQEQLSKTKATNIKMREAINNKILGLEAEHQRKMQALYYTGLERYNKTEASFIESHIDIVKEGSEEELEWKIKQLENQYAAELTAIAKSESEKTLTVDQAEQMRANLVEKYAKLKIEAEQEHANAVAEMTMASYGVEQIQRDQNYSSTVNALKNRYTEELKLAKGNTAKQENLKRELEDKLLEIDENYAQATVRATIDMIEKILKLENLSAEDRLKWEEELAKARIELNNKVADADKERVENQIKKDNELREKRLANIKEWMQKAGEAMSAVNGLVSAVYDGKISKIEDEQDAADEAAEKEQERITNLVEQNVITEEEGEARKRAAEERTALKNEELEKKKQQLKYKQAVWDKANSVAQAGIATALAIMEALQTKPFFPLGVAMAALAGTMGAIQVATILATPIPKYAKGTDYHKGGPAIVGDGGRPEVVLFRGGAWVTPDSPTLVDLPAGSSVLPDITEVTDLITPYVDASSEVKSEKPVIVKTNLGRLEEKLDSLIYVLKKHIAKSESDRRDRDWRNMMDSRL